MQSRSHVRSTLGGVSTIVLMAMIPLLLAVGALLTVAVGHHRELESEMARTSAASISFSGAQDALARLENARTLDGEFELAINGGIAHVVAAPWRADGVDNDANGLIDEPEEGGIFSIDSTGWINTLPDGEANLAVQSYSAATDVVAEVVDFRFSFGQAIYLDDPQARIDLNGGSFELSGIDEDLDGSPGFESARPAVGIAGDPAAVISQINGNQHAQIVGNLPTPAIGEVDPLVFAEYSDLLAPLSQIEWNAPSSAYSGAIGDFQARKGVIAHAAGDLKLHGTTSGAGILIVDGDLEIDGRFTFAGLVLVRGNVAFQGGGSRKEIFGALLVWGEDAGPAQEDLEINGTVQIAYSSEALSIASATGGVRVLLWKEQ